MSYTLTICEAPVAKDDAVAWREVGALVGREGEPPRIFHDLLARLTAKYPCICDLPDEEIDDGVWSDGPLQNNAGHKAVVLGLVWPRVEEVQPFIVETANALGLVVFDAQLNRIYRPNASKFGQFLRRFGR